MVIGRGQAGRGADGAVDVGDRPAGPADDVVMVVADARLIPRHRARWVDAPHEAGVGEGAQHVVDGLLGDLAELPAHEADDRMRVGVGMVVHRGEHGHSRTRDAQGSPAQETFELRDRRHAGSVSQNLETIQISAYCWNPVISRCARVRDTVRARA